MPTNSVRLQRYARRYMQEQVRRTIRRAKIRLVEDGFMPPDMIFTPTEVERMHVLFSAMRGGA